MKDLIIQLSNKIMIVETKYDLYQPVFIIDRGLVREGVVQQIDIHIIDNKPTPRYHISIKDEFLDYLVFGEFDVFRSVWDPNLIAKLNLNNHEYKQSNKDLF